MDHGVKTVARAAVVRAATAAGVAATDETSSYGDASRLRAFVNVQTYVLAVLALATIAVTLTKEPQVLYFTVGEKQAEPQFVAPLPNPNHTDQAILSWIGAAAADILNFGFHNYDQRLSEGRRYFTDRGWESFKAAVFESEMIKRLVEKQQVITAAPVGSAVILDRKETAPGRMQWTVQIPFSITVLSGKETQTQTRVLTAIIAQVPPADNLSGLGIDNWKENGA